MRVARPAELDAALSLAFAAAGPVLIGVCVKPRPGPALDRARPAVT
ncbi:MAG TPA: hypothetical protein VGH56_01985 [Solirubrobacteraceae bacterium]